MRNLLFSILVVGSAVYASAQKVYFIYLQSESTLPFYVKTSDKIYSSANSGYLILPNLVDSTYNFSIGFPSSNAESRFVIGIGGKDRGFLIKNLESGLVLFDLQTHTITKAQKDEFAKTISYQRRSDEFSSLLSKAANDTSLLYILVRSKEDLAMQKEQSEPEDLKQKTEEPALLRDTSAVTPQHSDLTLETKKQDSTGTVPLTTSSEKGKSSVTGLSDEDSKKDTVASNREKERIESTVINRALDSVANKTDSLAVPAKEEATGFKKSQVKKHSESSTTEGFGLVFYDIYEGGQDTIRLLIPNPPITFKQMSDVDSNLEQKDFIRVDELRKDTVQQGPEVAAKNNGGVACKSLASDNDFFKLRKNMAAKTSHEAMVGEAKKIFKNKCFTTEQIKNLSSLFLTSAGKYQFFEAAYLHVNDREKFSSLESEIKDDYYLKRFKSLVGE